MLPVRKLLSTVCAGLALTGFPATTWFVDLANGNDAAAMVDTTGTTAFKTIQAAVDNAAEGDTVMVGPGVYDTGATYIGGAPTGQGGITRCRVVIDKTLTLVGAGRDKTFIVGASDPDGNADGCGDNAIRCIGIAGTAGADTVIQGFTICDGRTSDGANIGTEVANRSRIGGGVFSWNDDGCTVVDCTLRNCGAVLAGAAYRAVLARCKIFDNLTYVQNTTCTNWPMGSATRYCKHYWCEIAGNRNSEAVYDPKGLINCTIHSHGYSDVRSDYVSNFTAYNCVFDHRSDNLCVSTVSKLRNCVFLWSNPKSGSDLIDCVKSKEFLLLAPALRDGHLVDAASECFGMADPRAVIGDSTIGAMNGIPERWRDMDLAGNAVDLETGKLNPGCYQEVKTPAGGTTAFYGDGKLNSYIDGNFLRCSETNYFHAIAWPTQHTFRVVSNRKGYDFLCTKSTRDGARYYTMLLPVNTNNFCRLMPAPSGHSYLFENYSGEVRWVDAKSSEEAEADGSAEKPFKTIQEAVSSAPGCVYHVKAGTYDCGAFTNATEGYVSRMGLRRGVAHRFVAEEGPAKTIIAGASDPDVADAERGCGPKAVRLVGYDYYDGTEGKAMSYFHGFTLTGGRSVIGTAASPSTTGAMTAKMHGSVCTCSIGGEASSWKVRCLMTDCVVSNNVAGLAVLAGVQTVRCLISDNQSIGGGNYASVCRGGFASGCVFRNNTGGKSVWGDNQLSIQCTMLDQELKKPFYDCNVYNCVVMINPTATASPRNYRGTVRVGYGAAGVDYPRSMYSEDLFADCAGGDFRLVDAADGAHFAISKISDGDMVEAWARNFPDDFYGNPLVFDENGRLAPGGIQERAVGLAVKVDATYGHGINAKDFVWLDAEGKATLTATEADTRVLKCFEVNGVAQPTAGATFTYERPTPAPTKDDVVTAVYYTDFYTNPDPTVGSDANTGCDPNAPALTLSNALSHCVAGDTVHAAPGVYDQKATLYAPDEYFNAKGDICVWTRAYIPAGVTLEATGSREETIIKGAPSPEAYDADYGCGPWATRCAVLREKAVLRGFTLTDGHSATKPHGGSEDGKSGDNQSCGGAFLWNDSVVENCVISNCVSGRSLFWGKNDSSSVVRNCVITGNRDLQDLLGLLRTVFVDGCFVSSNISYSLCLYSRRCANTTFGPGNTSSNESGYREASLFRGNDNMTNEIVNSVIHTRNLVNSNQKIKLVRCVYDAEIGATSRGNLVQETDCIETTRDKMAFEPNGAPVIGTNPAVDAGTLSDWTGTCPAGTDVWGNQRVYNGRVDIGAVEADWRGTYSRFLYKKKVTVDSVSPDVAAKLEDGIITGLGLPSGSTMTVTVGPRGGEAVYKVPVTLGPGTELSIMRNGESIPSVFESGTVNLVGQAGTSTVFDFSATGGEVSMGPFFANFGIVIVVE